MERPPNVEMVAILEEEMKRYVKSQVYYYIKPLAAKNFNYWKIWNLFIVKKYIIF